MKSCSFNFGNNCELLSKFYLKKYFEHHTDDYYIFTSNRVGLFLVRGVVAMTDDTLTKC